MHFKISIAKSILRILAELLGIVEELYADA
jgi:hypothetical protein